VARLGTLATASCDLDALVRLARSAPPLTAAAWDPAEALGSLPGDHRGLPGDHRADRGEPGRSRAGRGGPRVAVAGGSAFTFGYAEQAELLGAAGAEVVAFDPLRDESLPEGTGALIIGGGFPEMYAAELAANLPLLRQVASFRGPIAAECAGLLYLGRELDGRPMCGVLDLKARMSDRLTLGYRDAVAVSGSVLTREGERYRGHEFHRTTAEPPHGSPPLFRWRDGADGFGAGLVMGCYLHLHWAGSPRLAARMAEACR
jgi:cobyrinic acid a,c-diamide synthase